MRGTLFGGPYNKDPTIKGTILGSPVFGNPHIPLNTRPLNTRHEPRLRLVFALPSVLYSCKPQPVRLEVSKGQV